MKYKVLSLHARHFTIAALLSLSILSSNALAQQSGANSGIDLVALRNFAGAANVDGSGVSLLQVEAPTTARDAAGNAIGENYTPDPSDSLLTGNNFNDIGSPQSIGNLFHATRVGRVIYGDPSFGVAPAIGTAGNPAIEVLSANEFLNSTLGAGSSTPAVQTHDVSNHSYIFNVSNDQTVPLSVRIASVEGTLARLDYSINEGNTTTVGGAANGSASNLPAGLIQAYNTINVGQTSGGHFTGLTTLNTAGRLTTHVVANQTTTSNATAVVSGAAAILHQTGAGTDAVKQEVIKATILAGATKDDVAGPWTRTTSQPLDLVYGAGELNALNNHVIQTGGEVSGGNSSANATAIGRNGWDYEEEIFANEERFYEFMVGPNESLEDFSIALTWNRNVIDGDARGNIFEALYEPLADLSLELRDASNNLIDFSDSELDNVEHIFAPLLASGTYQIKVSNLSDSNISTDYGLAFRSTSIAISSIPEPSSIAILGFAALAISTRRRR